MGAGASKEELVYMAVQRGDLAGIRALRQQGASLEYRDSKGRTPLILACSHNMSYDAVHTLLQLGADTSAQAKGLEGGAAIHFAARKRLTRTVELLLNFGADPLARNDAGRSALDLAREQHTAPMVRLIESRVGLFTGLMRKHFLSNSLLKMLVPQWLSSVVWVAVVPFARGHPSLQLAIYSSGDAGMPSAIVILDEQVIQMTKEDTTDPKCVIQSRHTGDKLKFGSEPPDQPAITHRFYNACNGVVMAASPVPQFQPPPPCPPPTYPQPQHQPAPPALPQQSVSAGGASTTTSTTAAKSAGGAALGNECSSRKGSSQFGSFQSTELDDDDALSLALAESVRTASAERPGAPNAGGKDNGWVPPPGGAPQQTYGGWGDPLPPRAPGAPPYVEPWPAPEPVTAEGRAAMASWGNSNGGDGYGGWGGGAVPAPSVPTPPLPAETPGAGDSAASSTAASGGAAGTRPSVPQSGSVGAPSAPPLPGGGLYPAIDMTPVMIDYSAVAAVPPPPPPEPATLVNPAYNEARVKEELKKAENKSGDGQCVICWDAPAQAVCVPCGHMAGCMDCLNEVKAKDWGCPVCRTKIDTVIKVFQV